MVLNIHCYSHSYTVVYVKHAMGAYAKIIIIENNAVEWIC